MEYLMYIAIGYYFILGVKVLRRVIAVRFNLKEFYNDSMSLLLGVFVGVHVIALLTWGVYTVLTKLVHVTL